MRNQMWAAILLLWCVVFRCPAFGESAAEMASACKGVADAKLADGVVTFENNSFETGVCWGAFAALHAITGWVTPEQRPMLPCGCVPNESTRTQIVMIFLNYLDKHPEERHEDFVIVAMKSLKIAFPCRRK
jgi:hypothetical protein